MKSTQTRRNLIESVCGLGAMYIMPLLFELKSLSWLRYIVSLLAFVLIAGLYVALFHRFFRPAHTADAPLSTGRRALSYILIFLISLASIGIFTILPFGFIANILLSLPVNFLLTMLLCRHIAKK